jgi:protein-tyrosine phosphatase
MKIRVLFVCLGNICRSPLAEGIFARLVSERGLSGQFAIDSAGTGAWHVGQLPDERSRAVAKRNGISIDNQRARQISDADITDFDYVVAMDRSNHEDLLKFGFTNVSLLRSYGTDEDGVDVPDPYYDVDEGFDRVYEMVDRCCRSFLDAVCAERR